jgi:hypothetical protein
MTLLMEKKSIWELTGEENARRAMHGVLKQSFREVPSEVSKLVSLHQAAEGLFVV